MFKSNVSKFSVLFLGVCLSAAALSGCAFSSGDAKISNLNSQIVASKIVKNQTTKAEVQGMFGQPEVKTVNSKGDSTWQYVYETATQNAGQALGDLVGAANGTEVNTIIVIHFNPSGIVTSYNFQKTDATR